MWDENPLKRDGVGRFGDKKKKMTLELSHRTTKMYFYRILSAAWEEFEQHPRKWGMQYGRKDANAYCYLPLFYLFAAYNVEGNIAVIRFRSRIFSKRLMWSEVEFVDDWIKGVLYSVD